MKQKTINWLYASVFVLVAGLAEARQVNIVAEGKQIFETIGCSECHSVTKGDDSFKTGPNLYGLLLTTPRERAVMVEGKETKVKADRAYFEKSLRKAAAELAISETGPTKGTVYQPVMPTYTKALVSYTDMNSLYHYLRTLAEGEDKGPEEIMQRRRGSPKAKDILKVQDEEIVTDRTRVFRVALTGTSARAIHVGQTNGVSYTFDPRKLTVRRIWSGGFLNLRPERNGRGQGLSTMGHEAILHMGEADLLQPFTNAGELVDFEFKEPDTRDHAAIERHLWDKVDFADRLAALDAEFLGYTSPTGPENPSFRFRVGKNTFEHVISISDQGEITISLNGDIKETQKFKIDDFYIENVKVAGGSVENGVWTIPAGTKAPYKFQAQIKNMKPAPRQVVERKEDWSPQKLMTRPAAKPVDAEIVFPAGYSLQDWLSPRDLLGREQLFEPTGIAVAKDGTIVFATRTAGIWRMRDSEWTLFAEGTFDALGVCIEDDKGDVLVIAQKPELTRISDQNGDGRADLFETLSDDFGYHGNYSEYIHGPVKDAKGNYYFLTNLAHFGPPAGRTPVCFRAGSKYMGSMGGYRGWAMKVTPEGETKPFAMGLRSPAGIGASPDGRIWYAENQGEYVGSSHLVVLEEGGFYGHPACLESLPGMIPYTPPLDEEGWKSWKDKARKGAIWLPHSILANSPGNPTWDTTGGKFGPFQGQMFVGDQTLSQLVRVIPEQVDGTDQGCAILFGSGMASGIMRSTFLPDDSLLLGQTGRGWTARGGNQAALQQVLYDGKTESADILKIRATPSGFAVDFTMPLDSKVTTDRIKEALKVKSWSYMFYVSGYGSPQVGVRDETIRLLSLSADRKTVSIELDCFTDQEKCLDRVYQIQFQQAPTLFGDAPVWKELAGYYTLRAVPKAE